MSSVLYQIPQPKAGNMKKMLLQAWFQQKYANLTEKLHEIQQC